MAEALGLAASIAGVAGFTSLALGQGLLKLEELRKKLHDAPDTLNHAILSILTMEMQLQRIQSYTHKPGRYTAEKALLDAPLELCSRSIQKINIVIDDIEKRWKKSERFGRLMVTMKGREMLELLQQLDRGQAMLSLAVQFYTEASSRANHHATTQASQAAFQEIFDRLDRIEARPRIAPGSSTKEPTQQLVLQPDGNHATQVTDTSLCRRKKAKRAASEHVILRFRPWFRNTVYTLATAQATNGWGVFLRTYNIVPRKAEIFRACQVHDLLAVQKLFDEGRASPLDLDEHGCPLLFVSSRGSAARLIMLTVSEWAVINPSPSAAALLRMLGTKTDIPDPNEKVALALNALSWCYQGDPFAMDSAHRDCFEVLLDNFGFDLESAMETPERTSFTWWAFKNPRLHRLIVQRLASTWTSTHILEERVRVAISGSSYVDPTPYRLLQTLGLDQVDATVAAMHYGGESLLHIVARAFAWNFQTKHQDGLAEWQALLHQLIVLGADVHRRDNKDRTPFAIFLKRLGKDGEGLGTRNWAAAVKAMRFWASALEAAGIHLETYGLEEQSHWIDSFSLFRTLEPCTPFIEKLVYGSAPEDWDAVVYLEYDIPVFESSSSRLPGSWNEIQAWVPETICWEPRGKEEAQDHWLRSRTITIRSQAVRMSELGKGTTKMEWWTDCRTRYARDDQFSVVDFTLQEEAPDFRRRSMSVPSLPRRRQAKDVHRTAEAIKRHCWLLHDYHYLSPNLGEVPYLVSEVGEAESLSLRERLCGRWCNDLLRLRLPWPSWPDWQQFLSDSRLESYEELGVIGPMRAAQRWA